MNKKIKLGHVTRDKTGTFWVPYRRDDGRVSMVATDRANAAGMTADNMHTLRGAYGGKFDQLVTYRMPFKKVSEFHDGGVYIRRATNEIYIAFDRDGQWYLYPVKKLRKVTGLRPKSIPPTHGGPGFYWEVL